MYFGEEAWRHLITGFRCRQEAVPLLLAAVSCRFRIVLLFLTLKGTARAATFGPLQFACLTAQWRRLMAASARLIGMKFLPGKKPLPSSKTGCPKALLTPRVIFMFPSKAHLPLRSAAAFAH